MNNKVLAGISSIKVNLNFWKWCEMFPISFACLPIHTFYCNNTLSAIPISYFSIFITWKTCVVVTIAIAIFIRWCIKCKLCVSMMMITNLSFSNIKYEWNGCKSSNQSKSNNQIYNKMRSITFFSPLRSSKWCGM